jgi:hypothetical protein
VAGTSEEKERTETEQKEKRYNLFHNLGRPWLDNLPSVGLTTFLTKDRNYPLVGTTKSSTAWGTPKKLTPLCLGPYSVLARRQKCKSIFETKEFRRRTYSCSFFVSDAASFFLS